MQIFETSANAASSTAASTASHAAIRVVSQHFASDRSSIDSASTSSKDDTKEESESEKRSAVKANKTSASSRDVAEKNPFWATALGSNKINTTKKWHFYKGPVPGAETALINLKLLAGRAYPFLSEEVARYLGGRLRNNRVRTFPDGEIDIKITETVRGGHVFLLQSLCRHWTEQGQASVNDALVELLLMLGAIRRNGPVQSLTAVVPYFAYSRQDRKMEAGQTISASDIAKIFQTMGVSRVIVVDPHCNQLAGFFPPEIPVDMITSLPVAAAFFAENCDLENPVVVTPDTGGIVRAKQFRAMLAEKWTEKKKATVDVGLAMCAKQRAGAGVVERMDLVGKVKGSDCILCDDMIDTGGTLVAAANLLKERGARRVFAYATHGTFSINIRIRIIIIRRNRKFS